VYALDSWGLTRGWPSLNRSMAVAMILIQAFTITLLMEPVFLPVLLIALAGWMAPQMKLVFPVPITIGFALIILGTVVLHQIREEEVIAMGFIGSKIAFEVSCCCIACELFLLFVKKYADELPIWFLAISGTSMVFAGDIRVTYRNGAIMLWVMMAYLLFWSLFAVSFRRPIQQKRSLRRRHRIMLGFVLMTGLASAWFLAVTYQKYANRLEFWVTEYLYQGRVLQAGNGFSGKGGLSDINEMKRGHGNYEALHIQAGFRPDYLRGRVFTEFVSNRWEPSQPSEILSPLLDDHSPLRPTHPHESIYQFSKSWPEASVSMTVWPLDSQTSAHFFLPLGAAVLACDGTSVKRDSFGIVERDSRAILDSYVALIAPPAPIPPDQVDPIFLRLPARLHPVITAHAEEIFAEARSPMEKIRAVEDFFHNNFSYGLKLRIPRGTDRLAYFLTARPPAHCEYFATATTILLRAAGVPARYVTGYVVSGKNPMDGSYFALYRDAHAWVEAYDSEQQRWITVESTPAEGVPSHHHLNSIESAQNVSLALLMKLSEFFRSGVIAEFIRDHGFQLLLILAGTMFVMFMAQFYLKGITIRWKREAKFRPEFASLARERISLDRYLSRRGIQRDPTESLLHFADRLEATSRFSTSEALAGWYRTYVQLRFQGDPVAPEAVFHIREQRRQLIRITKVSSP